MGTVIGIELGQKRSSSAIAVVQGKRRGGPSWGPHFTVRYLERLAPGTRFPDVAARLQKVARSVTDRTRHFPEVFVDVTGLGDPIFCIMKRGIPRVTPVYFTHGDRRTEDQDELRLGKAWLVARLQALLQTGVLHLPKTPDAEELARDLLDYEIEVREDANERHGVFRVGRHDDLITALGLAVQVDPPLPRRPARYLLYG
jgi:hypothetical protein